LIARLGVNLPAAATLKLNFYVPRLPEFTTIDENQAQSVSHVLKELSSHNHPLLFWTQTSRMLANVPGQNVSVECPVYTLASKSLADNCVPWVEVPAHCEESAKLLGVTFSSTPQSCIHALHYLAQSKCRQDSRYCDWLIKLSACSSPSVWTAELKSAISSIPFLWLPSDGAFACPQDVFIFDDDRFALVAELFTALSGKKMISITRNCEYWHFSRRLKELGCLCVPSISDMICSLMSLASSGQYFYRKVGDGLSFLTDDGFVVLKEIYQFLETQIEFLISQKRHDRESLDDMLQRTCTSWKLLPDLPAGSSRAFDWGWRIDTIMEELKPFANDLNRLINSVCSQLPLVDHMKSVRLESAEYGMCSLLACVHEQLMSAVAESESLVTFVHPSLCKSCPRLISVLGIRYFESLSVIQVDHRSQNQERVFREVSAMFTRLIGRSFTVLGSIYVAASVILHENGIPLRKSNFDSFKRNVIDEYIASQLSWVVVGDIVFAGLGGGDSTHGSRHAVFARALDTLMRHFHPEMGEAQIRDALRRGFSEQRVMREITGNFFALDTWQGASQTRPTHGNLDEIFCDDKTTSLSSGNVLEIDMDSELAEGSSSSSVSTLVQQEVSEVQEETFKKRSVGSKVSSDFQAIHQVFSDRMVQSAQSLVASEDDEAPEPRSRRPLPSNLSVSDNLLSNTHFC
jgi:hypothetical protein